MSGCLKRVLRRGAVLLLAGLLVAGGGPALAAGYAFGVNGLDFSLSRYRILANGELRHLGHLPVDKATPTVAIHPSGRFVLVPSKTASNIAVFRLDRRSGEVTPVDGSPFPAQATSPFALAFHPSGRFVYAAARFSGVAAYSFDRQSGRLSPLPGSPFPAQQRTRSLVMHPSGNYVYAINGYSNSLSAYRVNQDSGVLTPLPGSPFSVGDMGEIDYAALGMADVAEGAGGIPYDIATDPQGRFLFIANWAAASVSVFRVDEKTGVPALVPGSPFFTGFNPYRLRVHPSGRFLFVAQFSSNAISVHTIDAASGRLSPVAGSPFASGGVGPVALTFSADGRRLYVPHYESSQIAALDVDPASGALSQRQLIETRGGPWDLALVEGAVAAPRLSRLLALQGQALTLFGAEDDGLETLAQASVQGTGLAASPDGRFAYLAASDGGLATLALGDGRITPVAGEGGRVQQAPTAMAIDINGWYLYGVDSRADTLQAWFLDPDSGIPRAVQRAPVRTGKRPVAVILDPAARYAYVVNAGDDTVSVFRSHTSTMPLLIDAAKYGSPFATGKEPLAMAVEPNGRYAYVANAGSDDISAYRIHHQTGALSALPGSPFRTGKRPVDLQVHPSGRWLYVANQGAARISIHAIERELGALANAVREVKLPVRPKALRLDAAGETLWVLAEGGRRLLRYAVDAEGGGLTLLKVEALRRPVSDLALVAESRK